MPRSLTSALLLAALLSSGALAQDAPASPVITSLKGLHDVTVRHITRTAEMLDEELYAYQPTDSVRSVGRLLAHIANAQYFFCSSAAGEPSPNQENLEETATTKDAIVAALQGAFAYCDEVYAGMSDAQGAEMRALMGMNMAASGVLAFNSAHNYEHYGNLVTYMRLNGIVPPSSQP